MPNREKQAWIWLLKNAGGRWPQRLLQKWGGANVYICTCLRMYVCMEVRGQCQLSSSAFSCFLRQGLSESGALWPANPRKLRCLCFISIEITHVYHCDGFFYIRCQRAELMPWCLHSQVFWLSRLCRSKFFLNFLLCCMLANLCHFPLKLSLADLAKDLA